jgi:hypothetical protein
MASPYFTKQPVYLEDPSGRFDNILPNAESSLDESEFEREGPANRYVSNRAKKMKNQKTRLNFPYTPTISIINSANYQRYDLTHSNFQQQAFDSHTNMECNITAPMIVRSKEEAEYVFRAATWLRSTMKMSWMKDDNPGMPPPILRFNAHGIYENVPCVIRDFTWNLDSDIDYVEIPDPTKSQLHSVESLQRQVALGRLDKMIRVPVSNMFVLTLAVTYSPKSIREKFSVKDYLNGSLKDQGYV